MTAAVPTESAADSDNSAALRRLLGALGDSQRPGMQSSLPVAPPVSQPVSEPVSSDAAGLTAQPVPPAMGGGASPAAPGFATSATVTVPVPDAAALSASAGQASDPHPIAVGVAYHAKPIVAAEARAYSPVAAAAFAAQSALVNAFHALMAVPIIACEAPK